MTSNGGVPLFPVSTFINAGKSLHGNFLLSIFVRGLSAMVTLTVAIVLARDLGVTEYGRYMAFYSAAVVLAALALRGSDQLLTKELAAGVAGEPFGRIALKLWTIRRLVSGVLIAAVIYLTWAFFGQKHGGGFNYWIISLGGVTILAFYTLSVLISGILNGYGASQRSQMLVPITNNGVVLLLLGGFWFLGSRQLAGGVAIWLQAAGCVLTSVVGWFLLHSVITAPRFYSRVSPNQVAADARSEKVWSAVANGFFYIAIANVLVNRLDVVLVSMLGGNDMAGIYSAGARLAQVAFLVSGAVTTILCPRISRAWHQRDYSAVRRLMRGASLFTISAALVEVVIGVFFGSDIIKVFGPQYQAAGGVFVLVVIAYALWTLAGPIYALLGMTGSENQVAVLSWLVAIVNIVAILVLVPNYGPFGAGLAMIAGNAVVIPFLAIAAIRKIRSAV